MVTWTVAGAEARAASGDRDGCGDRRRLLERCDRDRAIVPCNVTTPLDRYRQNARKHSEIN